MNIAQNVRLCSRTCLSHNLLKSLKYIHWKWYKSYLNIDAGLFCLSIYSSCSLFYKQSQPLRRTPSVCNFMFCGWIHWIMTYFPCIIYELFSTSVKVHSDWTRRRQLWRRHTTTCLVYNTCKPLVVFTPDASHVYTYFHMPTPTFWRWRDQSELAL